MEAMSYEQPRAAVAIMPPESEANQEMQAVTVDGYTVIMRYSSHPNPKAADEIRNILTSK